MDKLTPCLIREISILSFPQNKLSNKLGVSLTAVGFALLAALVLASVSLSGFKQDGRAASFVSSPLGTQGPSGLLRELKFLSGKKGDLGESRKTRANTDLDPDLVIILTAVSADHLFGKLSNHLNQYLSYADGRSRPVLSSLRPRAPPHHSA